jgi:hypothetical protein
LIAVVPPLGAGPAACAAAQQAHELQFESWDMLCGRREPELGCPAPPGCPGRQLLPRQPVGARQRHAARMASGRSAPPPLGRSDAGPSSALRQADLRDGNGSCRSGAGCLARPHGRGRARVPGTRHCSWRLVSVSGHRPARLAGRRPLAPQRPLGRSGCRDRRHGAIAFANLMPAGFISGSTP